MARKKTTGTDSENINEENIEDTSKEIIEEEIISEEELIPQGTPYKVRLILGDMVILEDMRGNGWKFPLPKEYKDAKKGDIIYL